MPAIASAAPTTAQIREKQKAAAAAQAKLQDLSDELEMKLEDYAVVNEALERTRGEIVVTEKTLAETQARLVASQEVLGSRAQAIYRGGPVDMIAVLLGTTDFNDFITRLELLNRISGSDAELVASIKADSARVTRSKTALENRENEQIALRREAASKKAAVQTAVSRQAAFTASLNSEVKKLIQAEEARLARIAAELARQAAARNSGTRRPSSRTTDLSKLGAPHPEALAAARKFVGVPYVWGGTTPSGFDCSGLMLYAYRQVGIALPRTSRSQYRIGAFIPENRTDLLEPGDLVFFGYGGDSNRVHHVGMYAGNGVYLHAPATGDRVKFSSLTERISSRGDYVGAVRP